mgnify:FL=1
MAEKTSGRDRSSFLDVEMKEMTGMEAAERIREFDKTILLVFVTGYSEYVFDGYRTGLWTM